MGAGTVLDPETARDCVLAGARFIVSHALNADDRLVPRSGRAGDARGAHPDRSAHGLGQPAVARQP